MLQTEIKKEIPPCIFTRSRNYIDVILVNYFHTLVSLMTPATVPLSMGHCYSIIYRIYTGSRLNAICFATDFSTQNAF